MLGRGEYYASKGHLSSGDKIYPAPDIPVQKLRNALANYGADTAAEEVCVLIDDTVFGSASEGVIVTREAFCFKEVATAPGVRRPQAGDSFSVEKGFLGTVVKFNGRRIMKLTQARYEDLFYLFKWVNELYGGLYDDGNPPRSFAAAVGTGAVGTKTCPFCGEEIKAAAVKCRFCGEMLETSDDPAAKRIPAPGASAAAVRKRELRRWLESRAECNDVEAVRKELSNPEKATILRVVIDDLVTEMAEGDPKAMYLAGFCSMALAAEQSEWSSFFNGVKLIAYSARMEYAPAMKCVSFFSKQYKHAGGNAGVRERLMLEKTFKIISEICSPEYCAKKYPY